MENKPEQFTQIPNSLMSNKDLTDQDKLTLGLILSFIKNNKECYMGNEYIAEKMGITKNAASSRVLRLQKIGCISLRYTYKEGKKEVDKRYITVLSVTPQVSSTTREVSSDRQEGIVPQTKGYRPVDEEVSSKQGGIIQPLLNNVLDNLKDNLPHKELNNKISLEEQLEQIKIQLDIIKTIDTPEVNETRGDLNRKQYEIKNQLKELV